MILIVIAIVMVISLGLVILFGFVLNEAAKEVVRQVGAAEAADYTVLLDRCEASSLGDARATGTLVNDSTKRQGFSVTVRFTTSDNTLISEDTTHIDTLDVGQKGTWTVSSFRDAPDGLQCEIGSVNYTIFDRED